MNPKELVQHWGELFNASDAGALACWSLPIPPE
jgi:hypothetical protein